MAAKPHYVKAVIDDLIDEGYLEYRGADGEQGQFARPVLSLSAAGEQAADEADLDELDQPRLEAAAAPPAPDPLSPPDVVAIRRAAL